MESVFVHNVSFLLSQNFVFVSTHVLTIVLFREELQSGSIIITLPVYLTHLSGKIITVR